MPFELRSTHSAPKDFSPRGIAGMGRETARLVEYLLCKHEELSLGPPKYSLKHFLKPKSGHLAWWHTLAISAPGTQRQTDDWGLLVSQSSLLAKFQTNGRLSPH